jgi:hypothetical protein
LCICQTRIYKTKAKETISGSIQQFQCLGVRADIWERCAVTWAVRGSERAKFTQKFACARLPGQCADIWERCADIWAARGFQGIKIHLISKLSSSSPIFAEVCLLYVLCGGVMIPKEDYNCNFMQEIDGGMMGCFASLCFDSIVCFSRQFFLISLLSFSHWYSHMFICHFY